MENKKVIIIMKHDITFYPPVISICKALIDLGCKVIYAGCCSNSEIEKDLTLYGVKIYKQPPYGGGAIRRFIQQVKFRNKIKSILDKEDADANTYLWLTHWETAILFARLIPNYKSILHFLEFRERKMNIGYRLLAPFKIFNEQILKAHKIVCCEYNRAQITKYMYNLPHLPAILPNKPYEGEKKHDSIALPSIIEELKQKFKNKKVILYQGAFQPERKLDDFIESIPLLPEEYIGVFMGPNNDYFNNLKQKYKNDKVFFLNFLPPPLHLEVTKLAYIGILSYLPQPDNLGTIINALYCAPNKIYEYAKFNIPMIANDVPALKFAFGLYNAGVCISGKMDKTEIKKSILEITNNYESFRSGTNLLYNNINIKDIINSIINDQQ